MLLNKYIKLEKFPEKYLLIPVAPRCALTSLRSGHLTRGKRKIARLAIFLNFSSTML